MEISETHWQQNEPQSPMDSEENEKNLSEIGSVSPVDSYETWCSEETIRTEPEDPMLTDLEGEESESTDENARAEYEER